MEQGGGGELGDVSASKDKLNWQCSTANEYRQWSLLSSELIRSRVAKPTDILVDILNFQRISRNTEMYAEYWYLLSSTENLLKFDIYIYIYIYIYKSYSEGHKWI